MPATLTTGRRIIRSLSSGGVSLARGVGRSPRAVSRQHKIAIDTARIAALPQVIGYWSPLQECYTVIGDFATVASPVGSIVDLSGRGMTATQGTTANAPFMRETPATRCRWLDSDTGDSLNITIASPLANCAIFTCTESGVTVLRNRSIQAGAFNVLAGRYKYWGGSVMVNEGLGVLSDTQVNLITRALSVNVPSLRQITPSGFAASFSPGSPRATYSSGVVTFMRQYSHISPHFNTSRAAAVVQSLRVTVLSGNKVLTLLTPNLSDTIVTLTAVNYNDTLQYNGYVSTAGTFSGRYDGDTYLGAKYSYFGLQDRAASGWGQVSMECVMAEIL